MEWAYRAPYGIAELGVAPGDIIIVAPAEDPPLTVVRSFDRNRLPAILEHLDSLTPLPCAGASHPEPLSRQLERAVGSDWHGPTRLRVIE